MSDDDANFEKRLSEMLAMTEDIETPPLSEARLQWLRSLIPAKKDVTAPTLSLVWKKMADGMADKLEVVASFNIKKVAVSLSPMRSDDTEVFEKTMFSCPLPDGEFYIQILPIGNRKAKLSVSVKGKYEDFDNLSVELLIDKKLIEARPLKQNAEMTISGIGQFSVILYSGTESVGEMSLNIEELKE